MAMPEHAAQCTFIGTATALLRVGGFTLLTDPNFLHRGQRAYLGYGLWSKRRSEPALAVDELPPLDAVVLSHLHGDHFDRVARRGLDRSVPILSTPQAARRLRVGPSPAPKGSPPGRRSRGGEGSRSCMSPRSRPGTGPAAYTGSSRRRWAASWTWSRPADGGCGST